MSRWTKNQDGLKAAQRFAEDAKEELRSIVSKEFLKDLDQCRSDLNAVTKEKETLGKMLAETIDALRKAQSSSESGPIYTKEANGKDNLVPGGEPGTIRVYPPEEPNNEGDNTLAGEDYDIIAE